MAYTTQQLIQILDQELRANWKGERILLSSADRIDNPVIAKAINLEKASKVFAYQDFRQQIHEYQRQHQVSGVVWRISSFHGKSVSFPEIHSQLIAVPGDKEILMAAKESVLRFWRDGTEGMSFWLAGNLTGDRPRPMAAEGVEALAEQVEWAEIDAGRAELYLGLCWGNPKEYQCQWARPQSGCYRIVAAATEPSPIKVY